MRLMAGLSGPRKGLIGPWSHAFPNNVVPGPAIGYLQEALRFWDHWLKGIDTGIMDEPLLRVWMEDYVAPAPLIAEHPGRWVAEEQWPSPRLERRVWALNEGTIDDAPAAEARLTHSGLQLTGMDAGAWCAEGTPGDWPLDQRAEDGRSLVFTSAPLEAPLEIMGFPEVTLQLAVDRPAALVCVRLCDVAPDGCSKLVTRQVLNLTHRDGHERPTPLTPGERYSRDRGARLDGARLRRRPPPARRRVDRLLAVGLALAREGRAQPVHRGDEPARPAGASARGPTTSSSPRSARPNRRGRPPARRWSSRARAAAASTGT